MVVTTFENEAENPLGVFGAKERREKERRDPRQAMFRFRILLNILGVTMLLLMACSVFGLEVEGGREYLIGLGEGAEGSPFPLLNPTFTLIHFTNEFIPPPFSANPRREEKEKEDYGEERESEKRGG